MNEILFLFGLSAAPFIVRPRGAGGARYFFHDVVYSIAKKESGEIRDNECRVRNASRREYIALDVPPLSGLSPNRDYAFDKIRFTFRKMTSRTNI